MKELKSGHYLPETTGVWMPHYGPRAYGSKLIAFVEMFPTFNGTGPLVTIPGVSRVVDIQEHN